MARIPYLSLAQMPEKTRQMLDRSPRPPLNIQLALAHAENSIRHYARFGNSLLTQAKLSPRFREVVILRVATLCNCQYEWTQHFPLAEKVGLTKDQIKEIKRGGISNVLSDQEKAIIRYTDEVVKKVKASDEAFVRIQSFLDSREIAELTLSICYWEMVAKCIESLGVDMQTASFQPSANQM
jgi:AhpD family alkylhydroperoxidase